MSVYPTSERHLWKALQPYGLAILSLAVATLVRLALNPLLGDRQAFMTYFATLIVVSAISGVGPSLTVLFGSVPLVMWCFFPPHRSLAVSEAHNLIAIGTFVSLGLLVVVLGGMLRRARHQAEESEQLFDSKARELELDRARLQQELLHLTDEMRGVDARREDFLALVANELRRPLVPIASAASFHSVAATASEMESAMDVVKLETTKLGRLIDDLLDAFRHNQGAMQLHKVPLDLAQIASKAVATVRSVAAQSGRELNVSLAKEAIPVNGDAVRLERVVYNLLMNAIRSTNPGGQIWLTALERDGAAVLKVKDTGVGLTEDAIPRVFNLNSQLDGSLARESGGLGISLTAIKPIVDMHGGMVSVNSNGLGQGCEFVVFLPLVDSAKTTGPAAAHDSPVANHEVATAHVNKDVPQA
ncbi:MAG TPA: ATP-binding protein [Pirellulales bacterium]|jgi:signal transduction histidine kinase